MMNNTIISTNDHGESHELSNTLQSLSLTDQMDHNDHIDTVKNNADQGGKIKNNTEQDELNKKIRLLEAKLTNLRNKRTEISHTRQKLHTQYDKLTNYKNQAEKEYYSLDISQLHSIAMRTQSNHDWLALTHKINALNDCFHIWHRGQFGTINGLRLGSDVPPIPIPEELKWSSSTSGDSTLTNNPNGANGNNSNGGGGNNSSGDYYLSSLTDFTSSSSSSHTRSNSKDFNSSNSNAHDAMNSPAQSGRNNENNHSSSNPAHSHNTNQNTNHPHTALSPSSALHHHHHSHSNTNPHSYNHFKVPWSEVNASLGTAALLLTTLEENRNNPIKFHAHKIIPMGSFSKIVLLPVPPNTNRNIATYNLYSDDSFSLFGKRNFNIALNALLKCLKDAADIALERDKTMALPHEISYMDDLESSSSSTLSYYNSSSHNKGDLCIGGLSISYGTDGERWTKALKYFLTDLKWLVAFVVKHVDR